MYEINNLLDLLQYVLLFWLLRGLQKKFGEKLFDWGFDKIVFALAKAHRPLAKKAIADIRKEEQRVVTAREVAGLTLLLIAFATKALFNFSIAATVGVLAFFLFLSTEAHVSANYIILRSFLALLAVIFFLWSCFHIEKANDFYHYYENKGLDNYAKKLEAKRIRYEKLIQ